MTVKVEGLKELQKGLAKLPGRVQARVVTSANRSGATVISREARNRVPVRAVEPGQRAAKITKRGTASTGVRFPGYLKKNIAVRRNRKVPRYTVSHEVKTVKFAWYGLFLEYGTSSAAAKPWLRPAFEAKKNDAARKIKERLAIGIEKQLTKLKR